MVTGHERRPGRGDKVLPAWGRWQGACPGVGRPALFSVTHENARNNHFGAANFDPDVVAYMEDFDPDTALGRWVDFQVAERSGQPIVSIALDTVNFKDTNVTGWPIRYGHLFAAVNDTSAKAALDRSVILEVEVRLRVSDVRPDLTEGYSGHRVMVGTNIRWDEAAPRTNKTHFIEIDLLQSDGYTESYGDPDYPLCRDITYDRCFYSSTGQYAEGREVRYQTFFGGAELLVGGEQWNPIRIDLSEAVRRLAWVSPPADWSVANLDGLYIGIESEGATRTAIDLRNYRLTAAHR
jgi:hypothetical protein